MRQELLNLLHNSPELMLLLPTQHIEWGRSAQTTKLPRIVLSSISVVRDYHLQGASGYIVSRVQIDIYDLTYKAVQDIANAVINILSGYRGGSILGLFVDNQRDLSGIEAGDPDNLFRQSIDVIVHHTST